MKGQCHYVNVLNYGRVYIKDIPKTRNELINISIKKISFDPVAKKYSIFRRMKIRHCNAK